MHDHFIKAFTLILLSLSSPAMAKTVLYMSDQSTHVYEKPSLSSPILKTIRAHHVIQADEEVKDGYIRLKEGYIKHSEVMVFQNQTRGEKSIKALVDTTFETKELPVFYRGTLSAQEVDLHACASSACEVIVTKKRGDTLDIIAKTTDGTWYKTSSPNAYVLSALVRVDFKSEQESKPEQKSDDAREKSPLPFQNTSQDSSDALLTHSGELALKYPKEAHIQNLTKTATPMPVKITARYARALDFPLLNKSGDVYTDYTFVWIKIKDEAFVLGKREGKTPEGEYTIHKRIH